MVNTIDRIRFKICMKNEKKGHYFSSMWERIFLSFCMMLLVSLPEIESEGEGLRISSACLMVEAAASDADVSDNGVSWKILELPQNEKI